MNDRPLTRLLGDTPGRVLVRLVFLSFVAGIVMAALGIEPLDLVYGFHRFTEEVWAMGFDAVAKAGRYFLLGAVVVVPLFVLSRLLKVGRGRA